MRDFTKYQTQERLAVLTSKFATEANIPSLRGVVAKLGKDTLYLTFYFDKNASEDDLEEIYLLCTHLLVQFSCQILYDTYVPINIETPLPTTPYLAYIRKEEELSKMRYEIPSEQTQERLFYLTSKFAEKMHISSLRGIKAQLEEEAISLHFYYNGESSEEEKEKMSILAIELFVQFTCPFLKEDYTRIDFPEPLPQSPYLAYVRKEEKIHITRKS